MKEQKVFYLRRFLNRKGFHSNAFVYASISKNINKTKSGNEEIWRDAELKLGDCDRIVSIAMDMHTKRETSNSLNKLNILITALQEFKSAFEKEIKTSKKR